MPSNMRFYDAVIRAEVEQRTMVIATSAVREYRFRFRNGLAIIETRSPLLGSVDWGAWTVTYGLPTSALKSFQWKIE